MDVGSLESNNGRAGEGTATFRYSVVKTLILAVIMAVLTLFPFGVALNSGAEPGFIVVLAVTSVFFGGWLLAMLARLFWRGPVLIVSKEGVRDRRIGPKTIPWARVRQVYVFKARSQAFLAVVTDAPADFAAPPGPLERLSLWVNDTLRLPRFSLSLLGLDASQRTIMLALRRFMPAGIETKPERPPRGF